MKEQITLETLARRFNKITFQDEEPESFSVYYRNNSSVGNRYIRWRGIWAVKEASDEANVVDMDRVYEECAHGACEWRHLFEGIRYGLIVGPKTHA
ncbi:MAG TPA: hypothetical protein EYQ00_09830, partial [Dehalococcoidia bacterium]|nr:hypothetical protein [Dehalococcoidia bacterium]